METSLFIDIVALLFGIALVIWAVAIFARARHNGSDWAGQPYMPHRSGGGWFGTVLVWCVLTVAASVFWSLSMGLAPDEVPINFLGLFTASIATMLLRMFEWI
ncbi:MAG: hypothetical protein AAGA48_00365 [Myxococcota bacterium]